MRDAKAYEQIRAELLDAKETVGMARASGSGSHDTTSEASSSHERKIERMAWEIVRVGK